MHYEETISSISLLWQRYEIKNRYRLFVILNNLISGREIDVVSREPLWEIGADYAHETGHGISHNGAVVEGMSLKFMREFRR